MKQPTAFFRWRPFFVMLFLSLFSLVLWGQEESGGGESTTTTTTTRSTSVNVTDTAAGDWYTSPWVWVIGAAVFILLLVALLSNRRSDTVRVSKTVERDHGSSAS